uniref:Glycosyltransferase n=1 Tax=Phenylobacterium glaciei TaxID=2803784 RepID=A0A974S9L3_9CAUL|nr:glycosyltransferase [Phenylobacterium glaciei]
MAELCFGLAGLFFLLSIHPYTFYPLSLWLMPRTPLRLPAPGWTRPTIAICMSAYNEERVIEAKVESLLAMVADYGPASINIYVDGSADRTAELLEPYRDRITLIVSRPGGARPPA